MDASYGINVGNRYALFMGDEDQDQPPQPVVSAKGKENKPAAVKKVPASSAAPTRVAPGAKSSAAPNNSAQPNAANRQKPGQAPRQGNAPGSKPSNQEGKGPRTEQNAPRSADSRGPRPPRSDNQGPKRDRIVRPTGTGENKGQGSDWPSSGAFPGGQREGGRPPRDNFRNDRGPYQPGPGAPDENRPPRAPRGDRGRGRGRGGFGGRDNRDNRGKPVFDRHSGSGTLKPVEKKEGAGSFNWGTTDDELAGQNAPEETPTGERSGDETAPEAAENTNGVEEVKEPEEEVEKQYTLDEWKKMSAKERAGPKFNIRKPGEGEDTAQWKTTFLLTKKKEEEEPAEEYEEITYEIETETTKRKKQVLDIDIKFRSEKFDDRRGRGRGMGPRRDDRGPRQPREAGDDQRNATRGTPRGGRGGPRGPRPGRDQAPPKVDDINDFPTLVTA